MGFVLNYFVMVKQQDKIRNFCRENNISYAEEIKLLSLVHDAYVSGFRDGISRIEDALKDTKTKFCICGVSITEGKYCSSCSKMLPMEDNPIDGCDECNYNSHNCTCI